MKIILEEKDLQRIDNVNADLKENPNTLMFVNELDRTYSIDFTVDDLGKANNFISYLLTGNTEIRDYIKESFGIKVQCLNYVTRDEMKRRLKENINEFLDNL